jgi:hypothetical protein
MKRKFSSLSTGYFYLLHICLSAFALLAGGIIYIIFHSSEPLFFSWINSTGAIHWINIIRNSSLSLSKFLPEWIVYSLPNGLWAFSYSLLITGIWSGSKSSLRYFWFASIPLVVLGFEFLQFARLIPGTFCLQDIALGIAGIVIGIMVGIRIIKPDHHEKAA